jgi:hypothetical protein
VFETVPFSALAAILAAARSSPPAMNDVESGYRPEYLDAPGMECINCLSREARTLKARGWQVLMAPIVVPVMCNRCLTSYYYPRMFLYARMLATWCRRFRRLG